MNRLEAILHDPHNVETLTFFGLVGLFSLWERYRPVRKVDHFADLKLDLLSFAFAVLMNRLARRSVNAVTGAVVPESVQDMFAVMQGWPSVVKIVLAVIVADFCIYWIHRAQHRFDFMWRTHKWHHSIEHMYWFAGFRTSFMHSLLNNIPQATVPLLIFQLSPWEAAIGYSIGLFIQFWEHTNVRVNLGPVKYIFISPQYHRVHHSATREQDMNLATTFAVWDHLFGTYVDPDKLEENFPLGLGEPIEEKQIPRML